MRRGLLLSFIAIAMFVFASAVGADVRSFFRNSDAGEDRASRKAEATYRGGTTVNARSYRSPGQLRKVFVAADDAAALARVRSEEHTSELQSHA